jgi:hypothetical protein
MRPAGGAGFCFLHHFRYFARAVILPGHVAGIVAAFFLQRDAGLETGSFCGVGSGPEEFREGMADGLLFCRTEEQEPALRWE